MATSKLHDIVDWALYKLVPVIIAVALIFIIFCVIALFTIVFPAPAEADEPITIMGQVFSENDSQPINLRVIRYNEYLEYSGFVGDTYVSGQATESTQSGTATNLRETGTTEVYKVTPPVQGGESGSWEIATPGKIVRYGNGDEG